uniref:glucan 1,3-beta-glucosidase n=1 Tax=Phytophthora ramorum TaxID=164328 RepID=H3H1Y9_PHYRM
MNWKTSSSRRVLLALGATVAFSLHGVQASTEAGGCVASGGNCGNEQNGPTCCESGNYCQPWNPSYYQCRPTLAQCGTPEVDVDFSGDDLFTVDGMKLPEECCNKCAETSGCAAFTFINHGWDGNTHCYLKSGTGTKKRVPGAVSAAVGGACTTKSGGFCGNAQGTSCCPSTAYCQPWNSGYYQCINTPTQCSMQLTDVDFYGSDMGVSFGGYPWDCCDKCSKTSGCVGYTFVNSDPRGPACYLKSGLSGKRTSVGAISGVVTATHVQSKIRSGAVQSKAVNLGAWFVSEYWMSWDSTLWKDVPVDTAWRGEYTVMKYLGKAKGTAAFEEHRKTWITEADISAIAHTGVLNTVRVPVGHWIIRDATTSPGTEADMYAPGGLKYVDTLINDWAVKYNLAVILSLHAHQGSQNGYESTSPPVNGETKWSTSQTNFDNSVKFATFLAARYKDSQAFLGLSLMNEPKPPTDRNLVLKYYAEAYKQIRAAGNTCVLLVSPMLSEQGPEGFTNMITGPAYSNVWNEIHAYFIWGYEDKSEEWILSNLDAYKQYNLEKEPKTNRLFVGEWCMGGPPNQNSIFKNLDNLHELGRKQLAMYNEDATGGWAFWSWRHSDEVNGRTGWSMRRLLRDGDLTLF